MSQALQKIDVFISSPGDVREERQIAIEVLKRLNNMSHIQDRYVLKPLAYEEVVPAAVGATPQSTVDRYMMEAGKSDIFICIMWQRMGTPTTHEETGEQFQSGTEYEFIAAYRANQERGAPHILLYRCMKEIPPDADLEQAMRVQNFFKRFEGATPEFKGLYKTYQTAAEFEDLLFLDLDIIIAKNLLKPEDKVRTPFSEPKRHDFYRHISLPVNYVIREELLAEVRAALLGDSPEVALTSGIKSQPTALHGMGGIGKSVMARALCDDPQVQAAFPDGILWTTLGQNPNLEIKMREWIQALGGTIRETAPTVGSLKANLASLLAERACLLIVDDVWLRKNAEAFRVGGTHCRLLITTRDAELARELGARLQPVPLMTVVEATQLLEEWADGALTDANPALKEQTVNRLGCLPLAVKLAGAQLKRQALDQWLETFDVRKLKSKRPEDVHDSLEQTFELSLEALGNSERHLYVALTIFKEDEDTLEVAIARLWEALEGLDEGETSELIEDLEARALLEVVHTTDSRTVRLHDLLRDLISAEWDENGRQGVHRALLSVYRKNCLGEGWHTAEDDGYLYDHVAYHLHAVHAFDELKALFADQNWLNVRFPQREHQYDGYLADLRIAWEEFAYKVALNQIENDEEPTYFADCIRYALIHTSINSLAGNYPPELITRAVETGLWTAARALSIAASIPDAEQQVKLYTALMATGKLDTHQRSDAQTKAFEACLAMEYKGAQARALAQLSEQLKDEEKTRALALGLQAVQGTGGEFHRVEALTALAPYLEGELLTQGFEVFLDTPQPGIGEVENLSSYAMNWARALAKLAGQLVGEEKAWVLRYGIGVALLISREWDQAEALMELAPCLEGELLVALARQLEAELHTALAIEDNGGEPYWPTALAVLGGRLGGSEGAEKARASALNLDGRIVLHLAG
jgi:NB-ARC domain/Domain of unknown function (DUF4062)/APAF-1 helical domain